jgi:hypothetical protein
LNSGTPSWKQGTQSRLLPLDSRGLLIQAGNRRRLQFPHFGRVEITAFVHRLAQGVDPGTVGVKIEALPALRTTHFAGFVTLVCYNAIDGDDPYAAFGARYTRTMNARFFLDHVEIIALAGAQACADKRKKVIFSVTNFRGGKTVQRKKAREKLKGCDIGYALAASSCEGANSVEACTVTALDVITAFTVPNPGPSSQSLPVFSGLVSLRVASPGSDHSAYFGLAKFYLSQPFQPSTGATLNVCRETVNAAFWCKRKFCFALRPGAQSVDERNVTNHPTGSSTFCTASSTARAEIQSSRSLGIKQTS